MMGRAQRREPRLFYTDFNLDRRVPPEHPLRRIARRIDFSFVRDEVAQLYGDVGNPSVDPAVLLKFNFLLFLENVPSERQLMEQMPLRLDWLWFCGYDLDSEIPDHSVLSKARRRWGPEVFASFFTRILAQCVEAGLVDGSTVHVDASVVAANASRDTVQPVLRKTGEELYVRLERVSEPPADPGAGHFTSPTDPDARLTRVKGEAVLGYKEHRVVDDRAGVITATETTGAATSEAHVLPQLLDQHARAVGEPARTVVADKQYGTAENYRSVQARGAEACIPHERHVHPEGKFPPEDFRYDAGRDVMVCPAGEILTRWNEKPGEQRVRYKGSAEMCATCAMRARCTDAKDGRRVGRHDLQAYVEWADGCLTNGERRRLMARRKATMEGSFADAANNHGFKRARWRGLEQVRIQGLLIAAIQNVRKLLRAWRRGTAAAARGVREAAATAFSVGAIHDLLSCVFGNRDGAALATRAPGIVPIAVPGAN
jgi:transposase